MKTKIISEGSVMHEQIHQKALSISKNFKRSEIELIEILDAVDRNRVYLHYGYNSLFKYTTDALGLSEEVAYIFINVSRKAREVPELKLELKSGSITVSKAKKLSPVLTKENQSYWLNFAKTASKHNLEKQLACANPKLAIKDQLIFVNDESEIKEKIKIIKLDSENARVQLQVGISEQLMLRLRKVQDILSSRNQKPIGLEDTLAALVDLYINKNDPLEKAKRKQEKIQQIDIMGHEQNTNSGSELGPGPVNTTALTSRNAPSQYPIRRPIPTAIRNELWLKADGQCTHVDNTNKRCEQKRFLHIHHEVPVIHGGSNEITNLALLCSGHHRAQHLNFLP